MDQTLTRRRLSEIEGLTCLHHLSEGVWELIPQHTAGDFRSDPALRGTSVPCPRQVPAPVRDVAAVLPRLEPPRQ